MLSAAELTAMQGVQAQTMVTPCTVAHRAYTPDGAGGQEETLTLNTHTCRLAPSQNMPDYQVFAGRANEGLLWRLAFPAGTAVHKEDKVLVGDRTFEILGVLAPATFETARRVVAVEV